jgi:PTK7 protein tyrosine kinase 7
MAPESLLDKQFSTKSDVYSFGVTCVEILTRKEPYPEMTTAEFAVRRFKDNIRLGNYIPSDTPAELRALIIECLSDAPKARPEFQDIHERLAEIKWRKQSVEISKSSSHYTDSSYIKTTSAISYQTYGASPV